MVAPIKQIITSTLSDKPVNRNDLLNVIRQHGHKCSLRTLRLIILEMNLKERAMISRTPTGYFIIKTIEQAKKFNHHNRKKGLSMVIEGFRVLKDFEEKLRIEILEKEGKKIITVTQTEMF